VTLGGRESGTARLEEAVSACRAALQEWTRERVPLDWATTQNNLGGALWTLGGRESGTARLEEAVAAYRAALEERTRERLPLGWATTQKNLGLALRTLGERESGTARLEEAVAAFDACLTVTETLWPKEWTQQVRSHRDQTQGLARIGSHQEHPAVAQSDVGDLNPASRIATIVAATSPPPALSPATAMRPGFTPRASR
jgi:tetratricopeptide (TPR) repeat protein